MDDYRSCLSIFISIYVYQVSIHLSTYIYNCLSTYLYIHLSIYLCIFLPKSEQLSRQKQTENVHCNVLSCWRTPQIYGIVRGTLDLFHYFLWLQWKTHRTLERLGPSPQENAHKFLCHFEQNKRENMKSCEKGRKYTLWAEINYGLSKEKRYRRLLQIERCCSRNLFCS